MITLDRQLLERSKCWDCNQIQHHESITFGSGEQLQRRERYICKKGKRQFGETKGCVEFAKEAGARG